MSEERQSDASGSESADDARNAAEESPARNQALARSAVAVLALIFSCFAMVGLIWLWLDRTDVDPEGLASADDLAELRSDVAANEQRFGDLAVAVDDHAEEIEALGPQLADWRQALREQADHNESLDRRVAELEVNLSEAVDRLEAAAGEQRAVDRDLARRLHLMEAAALLRTGQERAELTGDFSAAREAYRRAYRVLQELDDARTNRARGQVAQELEALEAVAGPDWTAMTAQLSQIGSAADEWPAIERSDDRAPDTQVDEAEDGWLARVGSTLTGLVRVRPRDTVSLSAEELDLVREQVRLRLAAAELALARRSLDEAIVQMQQARTLIERWFEVEDSAVARVLASLSELAETEAAALPSLGAALADINRLLEDS